MPLPMAEPIEQQVTGTQFATNLRCGSCVSKVKPGLDADPGIRAWSVDLQSPERTLTIAGNASNVPAIVAAAGFQASAIAIPESPKTSYFPLLLIVGYLLGIVAIVEIVSGHFDAMRAMRHFMAGFFLTFSFFKMLDVRGFADSFAMYDLIARRSRWYALAYPFIELGLGVLYAVNWWPLTTNLVTLLVMLVGTAGVVNSLTTGRRVRCACLGSVFNLPMSTVTLIEDAGMAVMAVVMLACG